MAEKLLQPLRRGKQCTPVAVRDALSLANDVTHMIEWSSVMDMADRILQTQWLSDQVLRLKSIASSMDVPANQKQQCAPSLQNKKEGNPKQINAHLSGGW